MWNGFDADVVYWHTRRSFSREPTAYTVYMRCREGSLFRSPKRYDPVEIGYFLASILADTDWAEEAEAWLAERAQAERPAPSARPGRRALNPVTRPEPER